ncbi:MAG: YgaP-like transmembrane domain [Methylococcaceae bacterium]
MSFDFKRVLKVERNLSVKEKQYRLYAGVVMILISVFTASIALLVFGVFCVVEFYLSWCPICSGLNRNTYENS